MSALFEELDYCPTSRGDLILRRRRFPMLENQLVYEVILNQEFLMTSMFHAAEDALADLGIAELIADGGSAFDVVVGGLGLGYTAAAALAHQEVQLVTVLEIFPELLGWHHRGLVPLGSELSGDPRCCLRQGDFFGMTAGGGYDPEHPGRKFDAVLLDIDHTPAFWLHPNHASFYCDDGLQHVIRHLRPGGVFALWADGLPSDDFTARLTRVFGAARAEVIAFDNPLLDKKSFGCVYVAKSS